MHKAEPVKGNGSDDEARHGAKPRKCYAAEKAHGPRKGLASKKQVGTKKSLSRSTTLPPRELTVDGLTVLLCRKRIKNINLRIKPPDGRVEVSAPLQVIEGDIVRLVRERRRWIDEKRAEVASSPTAVASSATPEEVSEWRTVVEACVPSLVQRWEPVLGVKAGRLVYRNMTSRWGSCQPATGRICINVRLALYPPACLEYVVVHELCHLIERGHGARFKALLDDCLPDWRERRSKLR